MRSPRATVLLAVAATLLLAGCTPIVTVDPAEDAADVLCAAQNVRLPETIAGLEQRETNGQGTGAWGDPAAVLLACGFPVPGPSELACVRVDGIDWIRNEATDTSATFTTYGRDPATRVIIDRTQASPGAVLDALAIAMAETELVGECTDPEDTL